MKSAPDLRDEFIATTDHIRRAIGRVLGIARNNGLLTFPDSHKIGEGLFLSAVTHWEEFCRNLLESDLLSNSSSCLRKGVVTFKTQAAKQELAERLMTHIDHPGAFYDWADIEKVYDRFDSMIGTRQHRFANPINPANPNTPKMKLSKAQVDELKLLKLIRNAVAHRTDKARHQFLQTIAKAPFSLPSKRRKGITPGRFLVTVGWDNPGDLVILHTTNTLEACARVLVP